MGLAVSIYGEGINRHSCLSDVPVSRLLVTLYRFNISIAFKPTRNRDNSDIRRQLNDTSGRGTSGSDFASIQNRKVSGEWICNSCVSFVGGEHLKGKRLRIRCIFDSSLQKNVDTSAKSLTCGAIENDAN